MRSFPKPYINNKNFMYNLLLRSKTVIFILVTNFFCVSGVVSQDIEDSKKTEQPNIIFIITDDLGWGDLGVLYQEQREKAGERSEPWNFTPHLDKLAAQGATLPHHYCAAPVCAPSRASLLLGVSQGHANVRNNQFDKALEDNHTLATVLSTAGYNTAAIGKWGLQGDNRWDEDGDEWPAHPLNRGFDYFLGYMRHVDGHEHYPKEGIYRGSKEVWENRTEISSTLDKCFTPDLWTAAAKRWIMDHEKHQTGKPFFMYLSFDTPHAVLELPTQPYPAGGGVTGGLQWLGKSGEMINTASGKIDSWVHPDYANATYDDDNNIATPEVPWPDVYKRYAGAVRRIDNAVGDIQRLLKDLAIDSNTLIVFTSDNGPSLESYISGMENNPDFFNSFGPFTGVKRDVLEGGVRMPTIASWPEQIPANTIIEHPSISYDWLPTLSDAAGISAPARTDGVSLLPSLSGVGQQEESLIYVEYSNRGTTPGFEEFAPKHRKRRRNQMQLIRVEDYVGIRYNVKSHADDFEIYDIINDPGERKDLAPEMQELQKKMKEKVLQVRQANSKASRPYDNELVPAVQNRKIKKGVLWNMFEGKFPWIPDVSKLTPMKKGRSKYPEKSVAQAHNGVVVFNGYLKIPEDGKYTFFIKADQGALLRIHEATVIDADYGYAGNTERQGAMFLEAGLHPFTLYHKRSIAENPRLEFQWEGPGITKQNIPAEVFFHGADELKYNADSLLKRTKRF